MVLILLMVDVCGLGSGGETVSFVEINEKSGFEYCGHLVVK
jgi:hypothetical protein